MPERILGIDPGTVHMGYALLEENEGNPVALTWGAFSPKRLDSLEKRLLRIYLDLESLIKQWHPTIVAVEEPFFASNARSAIAIGQAQALAFLAAANNELPLFKYTPTQVKQAVADYGLSTKEQVQQMVKIQLGLQETPEPQDASDALAIALCHLRHQHERQLLEGAASP